MNQVPISSLGSLPKRLGDFEAEIDSDLADLRRDSVETVRGALPSILLLLHLKLPLSLATQILSRDLSVSLTNLDSESEATFPPFYSTVIHSKALIRATATHSQYVHASPTCRYGVLRSSPKASGLSSVVIQ